LLMKALLDIVLILPCILASLLSRMANRPVDVGLGPEPLISYLYHKKALLYAGYKAETYVGATDYITDKFDYSVPVLWHGLNLFRWHWLFFRSVFRYRCLYFSFHGGPLMGTTLLRSLEPWLLKWAGIKTVLLPYGSDVQDMTRCPNLSFRHAMARDYPAVRANRRRISRQIDRWTKHADHIIAGCDWVDYMYQWDTLSLAHFSIDTGFWKPEVRKNGASDATVRILHAPNHKTIKGTDFFVRAVEELRQEGVDVEIVVLERASNEEIRRVMSSVDMVADQLIIGWYAMFAMEGMALGKPVLCHIRRDLESLYIRSGLIEEGELPLIRCEPSDVKRVVRELVSDRGRMKRVGEQSRRFVARHHSLEAIADMFDRINRAMGVLPAKERGL